MAKLDKIKYLIIGNSAGGIGAAEAIRELDGAGTIAIVSDEPYAAYSRPLISEHLFEGRPLERMLYRPADFYEQNNIQTVFGEKVAEVDYSGHSLKLKNGRNLEWQKLLLATGGSPIVPKMDGGDAKGIFTFTKLDDAREIDKFLTKRKGEVKALVIGGGLIGVSASEALVKRGVKVAVVEMKDWILNTILDEEAASLEAKALAAAEVEIITGQTVAKINKDKSGAVSGATLDDGRTVAADMIVVAIGVTPRLELAYGKLKTNRGIVVDRAMQTSAPDVYACGDVAEAYDFVFGENRVTPVWPNAYVGGRVAGQNMAGSSAEYVGGTAMNSLKYFGINIVSAGMVSAPDKSYEVVSKRRDGVYKKIILKDGLVAGLVFAGDFAKAGIVYNLMKDKVKVDGFKDELVGDDFGLASLPEDVWRARLESQATGAGE
ncbi:MAG: FAD-dependent oxidoreductase [Dehalococcoidia bacterium]|jgi:NAD(P)H-nitrite reductase large subunit